MHGRMAPKPDNFDELTRTWDDPEAFARELARYYEQLLAERTTAVDITQPRRAPLPAQEGGSQ